MWHWTLALLVSTHLSSFSKGEMLLRHWVRSRKVPQGCFGNRRWLQFGSRTARISVISKCTSTCFGRKCLHFRLRRCITIWKVKVIIWVDFLISFIAAVRTVVVQLIIFLFYWSGAKNNLPPGYLNLFHRFESMRTLRICKRILKLDNKRIRSVCLFLCACKHVVV